MATIYTVTNLFSLLHVISFLPEGSEFFGVGQKLDTNICRSKLLGVNKNFRGDQELFGIFVGGGQKFLG